MARCAAPFTGCTRTATTTATIRFANGSGTIRVCEAHAEPDAITLAQAGALLGVQPASLRNQIHNGKLRGRLVGKTWTVSEREVERYRAESLGRPGRRHAADTTARKRAPIHSV